MANAYVNHKQTWTLFDRDGDEVESYTEQGWENTGFPQELLGEEAQLIDEEEGDIEYSAKESITHSSLLHEETQEITCGDVYVGKLVYTRECELETDLDRNNKILAAIETIIKCEPGESADASDILNAERKLAEQLGEMRDDGNQYAYDDLEELIGRVDESEEELRERIKADGTLF